MEANRGTARRNFMGAGANALLLLASLAVSFAALEMLVRWTPLGDRMGGAIVPPVAERVAGAALPKPGIPRILALGDSFTVWRDTTGASYPRVAARALAEGGVPVDLVNLAEGGSGPKEYFVNVLRHADALKPDLVIVGIYFGNDLFITSPPLDTPEGVEAALAGEFQAVVPWWKRQAKRSLALTYAYRLLKRHVPALRSGHFENLAAYFLRVEGKDERFLAERLARVRPDLVERAKADTINPWDLVGGVFWPDHFGQLAAISGERAAEVEGGLRNLGVLAGECRRHHLPMVAVLLPPPVWVSDRYTAYFRALGFGDLGPLTGPVPAIDRVKGFLDAKGVPFLDALPLLRAAEEEVYLPEDEHLNTAGQRLVGQALADMLKERGLIPPAGGREQ